MLDSGAPFYDTYETMVCISMRVAPCSATGAYTHIYIYTFTQDGLYMAVAAIEPVFFRNMLQGLEMGVADVPDPTNPKYIQFSRVPAPICHRAC